MANEGSMIFSSTVAVIIIIIRIPKPHRLNCFDMFKSLVLFNILVLFKILVLNNPFSDTPESDIPESDIFILKSLLLMIVNK